MYNIGDEVYYFDGFKCAYGRGTITEISATFERVKYSLSTRYYGYLPEENVHKDLTQLRLNVDKRLFESLKDLEGSSRDLDKLLGEGN